MITFLLLLAVLLIAYIIYSTHDQKKKDMKELAQGYQMAEALLPRMIEQDSAARAQVDYFRRSMDPSDSHAVIKLRRMEDEVRKFELIVDILMDMTGERQSYFSFKKLEIRLLEITGSDLKELSKKFA